MQISYNQSGQNLSVNQHLITHKKILWSCTVVQKSQIIIVVIILKKNFPVVTFGSLWQMVYYLKGNIQAIPTTESLIKVGIIHSFHLLPFYPWSLSLCKDTHAVKWCLAFYDDTWCLCLYTEYMIYLIYTRISKLHLKMAYTILKTPLFKQ